MGKLKTRDTFEPNTEKDGAGYQYYDQVCALSQAAINRSFEKLFENRPDVGEMEWEGSDSAEGELKAKLLAPSVELSLENRAECEIFYQLRINTGRIDYGKNTHQDVSGWVISLPAKMQSTLVSVDPDVHKTDEEKELAAAQLAEIEENVDLKFQKPTELIPGEYSIHRLFAAIASHAWGSPVWERSYITNEKGVKVTLSEWFKKPGNNLLYAKVTGTLSKWAMENRTSSLFTLGMQLRMPRGPVPADMVTFVPKALSVQNYPYLTDRKQQELADKGLDLTGTLGDPYNCFCYCEVADKDRTGLPGYKLLPFSGNLALPKEGNREQVPGTFVLDHRLFLEKHLLPQLQELNVGTQIIPLTPFMEVVDHVAQFKLRFCSGTNPEDAKDRENLPPMVASDPAFKFTLVAPQKYEWKSSRAAPGSTQDFVKRYGPCTQSPFYRRYVTTSDTTVTVSWTVGKHSFEVKGSCIFKHWESHSFNTDDWPNGGTGRYGNHGGEYWWSSFTDIATWSFIVDLPVPKSSVDDPEIANGVIEPKLVGVHAEKDSGEELVIPDNFTVRVQNMQYNLEGTHKVVEAAMNKSIGKGLARAAKNIKKNFHGIGKFVYPGAGELRFGPPSITESGNIIANIDYLAPKESRVSWNPPKKGELEKPKQESSVVYVADPSVTKNEAKISWTIDVISWNPSTYRLKMSLKASNISSNQMAFKSVKFMPLRMKHMDDKRLFNERWDKWGDQAEVQKRLADLQKTKADRASARKAEAEKRLKDRADQRQKAKAERKQKAEAARKEKAAEAQKKIDEEKKRRAAAKKKLEDDYAAEDAEEKKTRDAAKAARLEARKKMTEEEARADVEREKEEDKKYELKRDQVMAERAKKAQETAAAEAAEDKKREAAAKEEAERDLKKEIEAEEKAVDEEAKTEKQEDDAYATKLKEQDEAWKKEDAALLEKNPIPTEIYQIAKDSVIKQELIVTPLLTDQEFQLNCTAKVLKIVDGIGKPDRFVMPSKSNFTLALDGKAGAKNGAGAFVVQLNEIWASPTTIGKQVHGRADKFIEVELKDDGNSSVKFVSTEEADKLRGVESATPAA